MVDQTDRIISVESAGDPTARNERSSAAGPGQFIDSTWLATLKTHRPDLADGQSDADLLALKNNPQLASQPQNIALAKDMTAAYSADNQAHLQRNGLPVTPGTTYLAHFAGPGGAVKVLSADPNAPVESILGGAAVAANPFLKGMTAQGLQAWAAKKMGTAAPVAGTQPAAPAGAPGTPSAAPAPPVPQQRPPIFAGAAPSAAPVMPPAYHDPAPQLGPAAPIFAAQRKPVDISGLRAALAARAPIFTNQG
jgi:hypothetical protein